MGVKIYCVSGFGEIIGWESSVATWRSFLEDDLRIMDSQSPLNDLVAMSNDRGVAADRVGPLWHCVVAVYPFLNYHSDDPKCWALNDLVACLRVAYQEGLDLIYVC